MNSVVPPGNQRMDDCKCLFIKVIPANKERRKNEIKILKKLICVMSYGDGTQREIKK